MLSCFGHVDHDKLWKDLREMGIPDHFICLLRNLYEVSEKPDQEATVRTLYGTTVSRLRKECNRAVCCYPVCLTLSTEHIMRNARLDELQAGIKLGERNINNLRYTDDTTLMELKSFLMRVKEESERASSRINIFFLKN